MTEPTKLPEQGPTSEGTFLLKLLVMLGIIFVALVVGFAGVFLLSGVTSVGIYEPPIGQVMSFAFNAAEVSGIAVAAIFALVTLLHQIPAFRKRIDAILKRYA